MKIFLLAITLLTSFASHADQNLRVEIMSADGEREISIGTMLSPPGLGAVGRAKIIAKKNLKKKCNDELNGKIVGEIKYETLRFDSGIMAAIVRATGECKYE